MRYAYADPPYPGLGHLYPENAEVDHGELLDRLIGGYPDGWALSTNSRGLWEVIPLVKERNPAGQPRIAIWHIPDAMPFGVGHPQGRDSRIEYTWEAVIFCGGRGREADPCADLATIARPDRRHRRFMGRKPEAFAVWVCRLLGVRQGDQVADLFPGSGAFGHSVERFLAQLPLPKAPRQAYRRSGKHRDSRGRLPAQDGLPLEGEAAG